MDQCEDGEDAVRPSKMPLSGGHEDQRKQPEPEPETGSGQRSGSLFSDRSKGRLIDFKQSQPSRKRKQPEPEPDSGSSSASLRSDSSKGRLIVDQQSSEVPSGPSAQQLQTQLDSIFMEVEQNMFTFMKEELNVFKTYLSPFGSEYLESQTEGEDEEHRRKNREHLLNITVNFLRRSNQEGLATRLHNSSPVTCQSNLKANMKNTFQQIFEGVPKAGKSMHLSQIYTEVYITEGGTAEVNQEHEVRQIETASRKPHRPETAIKLEDIFKAPPGRDWPIRTVMTMGVAGIGKTVLTQKFTLDWAEDKTNQNIQFIFPFTFRELNVLREKKFSLVELIHHFFPETKGIFSFEQFQVLFIFDGLDESRLGLDFNNNPILTDVTESSSVDVLLTNLIRGKLLPSALLWITTRPAAANQIPAQCVGMVTEIRGFTNSQKEEYFKKRFKDEEQANRIISHIKTSRSLHIMCRIPVFCWITATVLEDVMKTTEGGKLPKTLTEMYIQFLVVQTKVKKVKYDGGSETDPHWSPDNKKMIESLGKLAFDQLQKGNLIFYESDLTECGIDIRAASVYSGVFTQIFREERGLYQDKVFCFVHLSVQEFLAALHVHLTFINSGVNLLEENLTFPQKSKRNEKHRFFQSAVDMALQSPNGHLDLFLRFFLGLSLQTNQTLLKDLLTREEPSTETTDEAVQYIKRKMSEKLAADKIINLFDCLSEMNDLALVEEVQESLSSGRLSTDKLSSAQWSALVFILLSSEKDLNLFDLKKFINSDDDFARLLPVLDVSSKALLSVCNLSPSTCATLSTVLSSQSSHLRELDLSNNDLRDKGVTLLCGGLRSVHCTLTTLRLSGCLITEEGCASLASALDSNPIHLKELDLSYNHPGEEGVKKLTVQGSTWKPEKLRMEPAGVQWLTPGLKKYSCQLTIDTNTVNKKLQLSENNRKVTGVDESQSYPDHEQRFDYWPQVLCKESLPDRCYWEVIWSGKVEISVSYSGVQRKGGSNDCEFGFNNMSWSLSCSDEGRYSVCHQSKREFISSCSSSAPYHKVGVYVDYSGGTLSFYRVSSEIPIHLHTLKTEFTQPLYPGFGFWTGSSVTLC
ncbi:NACHT, LRR and PYD domains-containing protein 5-like isoform X2 [Xiphophorus couchianus]|uniref:NACHT, LRR and PYD domains-containing protein 5-like isoform X2 n=1 Tax=Xiphophorus couchianus TaxID=32473 RepID=UPI0010165321|nr:NACHT, LRR and PYD domains-containing protein 5-like isoform X2 [Xiphophorus couchianus]